MTLLELWYFPLSPSGLILTQLLVRWEWGPGEHLALAFPTVPWGWSCQLSAQHLPLDPSPNLQSADGSHTTGCLGPRCLISPTGPGWEDGQLVSLRRVWLPPQLQFNNPRAQCVPLELQLCVWSTVIDRSHWMSWLQWRRKGSSVFPQGGVCSQLVVVPWCLDQAQAPHM